MFKNEPYQKPWNCNEILVEIKPKKRYSSVSNKSYWGWKCKKKLDEKYFVSFSMKGFRDEVFEGHWLSVRQIWLRNFLCFRLAACLSTGSSVVLHFRGFSLCRSSFFCSCSAAERCFDVLKRMEEERGDTERRISRKRIEDAYWVKMGRIDGFGGIERSGV